MHKKEGNLCVQTHTLPKLPQLPQLQKTFIILCVFFFDCNGKSNNNKMSVEKTSSNTCPKYTSTLNDKASTYNNKTGAKLYCIRLAFFLLLSAFTGNTPKFQILADGLQVRKVTQNDTGEYTCRAYQVNTIASDMQERTILMKIERE